MDEREALAKALYESGVADNTGRYADFYPKTEWGDLSPAVAEVWGTDALSLMARLLLAGYRVAPKVGA